MKMGNGSYNHHLHHQSFHHGNGSIPTFFPLLCRVSIKDTINLSKRCPNKDDPSSPRVSCMGKVKRRNTKLLLSSFSSPLTSTTKTPTTAKVSYTKLKKIFSGKNLLNTTAGAAATTNASSCRSSKEIIDRRRRRHDHAHDNNCTAVVVPLNLAEMDPPLPVVKKVSPLRCGGDGGGEGRASLWKRRSGGAGLRRLQIQQFQLANKNYSSQFLSPTTV